MRGKSVRCMAPVRVWVLETEVPYIFRGTSGARPDKLATEDPRRAEVWEALWDLGAARRSASQTLIENAGDSSLISDLLDGLQALQEWRATLLEELGLPDNAIRLINNFLCLLERTRLTPEEARRLLLVPQLWSSGPAVRKWSRRSSSKD